MPSFVRPVRVAIILIGLFGPPGLVMAQWTPNGVPVASGPALEMVGAASDLNGGAYIVWEDRGSRLANGFVRRVRNDGSLEPSWPAEGIPVCDGDWARYATTAISDDQGGVYVAWLDDRSPPPDSASIFGVYLTRISFGGRVPGWSSGGTPLCLGPCAFEPIALAHDTFGGVFAAWSEAGGTRVMHLEADGRRSIGWPASGISLAGRCSGLAPDGQGGGFVSTSLSLYHLGYSGGTVPGWPAGGLAVAPYPVVGGSLVSDDSGGVYCVWSQMAVPRDTTDGVYAQRIRFDGATAGGWPDHGVRLSPFPADQISSFWVSGGAIAAWATGPYAPDRILAQRVERGGITPSWPPEGLLLGDLSGSTKPCGISDGGGGAFIAWDHREVNGGRFASLQHVLADGHLAIAWPAGGIPLSSDQGSSRSPFLAGFAGPEIAAWVSPSGGAENVVRAARVTDIGPSITAVRALCPVPRPDGLRVQWIVAAQSPLDLTVEREDRLGWSPIGTLRAAFGIVGFTDTQVRPGMTNHYRLSLIVAGGQASFGEVTVTVPLPSLQIRATPANPARGALGAEVQLPNTAPAILELFDARGRLLERQEIAGGAPRVEQYRLGGGRRLSSGVYFLRLTQLGESASKRVVFLR
ncbi:MAG TPA: T9SS type A sorting domain-containing protein [Candidatus Omnitrophota bacterium]|nr:T9SS type A sorting domain-containing protein [Candidatus Omnitrophota bacterium]